MSEGQGATSSSSASASTSTAQAHDDAAAAEAVASPLGIRNVTRVAWSSLPGVQLSETSQDQSLLKTAADLIVVTMHAYLTILGFKFRGIGEDPVDPRSHQESGQTGRLAFQPAVLPSDWNATGDTYSLRYTHDQSSFTFLLKGVKIATKLILHCLAVEDGKLHTMEVTLSEFVASSKVPVTKRQHDSYFSNSGASESAASPRDPFLLSLYSSSKSLEDLLFKFRAELVDRVMPGINKPGYQPASVASTSSSSSSSSTGNQYQPRPQRNPWEDYEDPLIDPRFRPGRGGGIGGGGIGGGGYPGGMRGGPFGVGDVDLDPFAAAPGILPPRGGFGMGGGGMHLGGGMFVDPSHPMFGGGGAGGGPFAPGRPPYGGPGGFLPPGAVPPGARFDPIGPFGGPGGGIGPGRGGRPPPRGGGGAGGTGAFRMGPDNDEMPPPGFDDSMYM